MSRRGAPLLVLLLGACFLPAPEMPGRVGRQLPKQDASLSSSVVEANVTDVQSWGGRSQRPPDERLPGRSGTDMSHASPPRPTHWPFIDEFPRVAGVGATGGGGFYWTDFIYDDRGARGRSTRSPATPLAPSHGTYEYGTTSAFGNGADIFRAAIGADVAATYWRVDWNTLADPAVPLAVWTIDGDADAATGVRNWPAGAGIRSAGIDHAVVVSATTASVVDLVGSSLLAELPVGVDLEARSFTVRVPRAVLSLHGVSRVRLASGVANSTGRGFEPVPPTLGGMPGGGAAAVYNVAFRSRDQEPPLLGSPRSPSTMNPWMEGSQAQALAAGDVSSFFADVDWAALDGPGPSSPLQRGWINRWYVSSIEAGSGVVWDPPSGADLRPNYLGRVQPYAIYVPSSYDGTKPSSLTWLLHSAFQGHNAFGVMTPRFVQRLCEARGSICVTPLGRGHDGWYLEEAELDFWEVWNDVAQHYRIDPERVVIGGFSMGGYGAYRLALSHPDLFASGFAIGATPTCGRDFSANAEVPAGAGRCASDGDTTELLESARWVPFYVAHGTTDELLPIGGTLEQVGRLDALGYRYRFDHFAGQPHIPWYAQDMWGPIADAIGDPHRVTSPARFSLRWRPHSYRADLGFAPKGGYWLNDVAARDVFPGAIAAVDAHSAALADRATVPKRSETVRASAEATPAHSRSLEWDVGAEAAHAQTVTLAMKNIAAATLEIGRAGLGARNATIRGSSDGGVALTLSGASGPVLVDGERVGFAKPRQPFSLTVKAGSWVVTVG
jgi:hypothetical protein